ncbi:NADPH-dependent FMN reductase [Vibrio breoganii]
MKVIAFGASTSSNSINKQLAAYTAKLIKGAEVEVIDLNDFPLPLFGEDKEKEVGKPENAQAFFDKLGTADALVISFAEHNGAYTAAFKNLFDWTSRIDQKVYQGKSVIFLATSPGPGGAGSVLASATGSAPYFAAEVKASVSVPNFYDNFDASTQTVTNDDIQSQLLKAAATL